MNNSQTDNLTSPCTILVVAAGRGHRFGDPLPKQYHLILGKPLLFHTLAALHQHPLVHRILPIIAPDDDHYQTIVGPYLTHLPKVLPPVAGGKERQDSVQRGLAALPMADHQWVGIHDAARPMVSPSLLDRLLAHRNAADAIIPALAAQDTIKMAGSDHMIQKTLPREHIWLAQTPQFFRFGLIRDAHAAHRHTPNAPATDDAAMVEQLGWPVLLVAGDPQNIKITQPWDLTMAAWLMTHHQPTANDPTIPPASH